MKKCITFVLLTLLPLMLIGCYRMPGENDCSVIPTTNNLSITGQGNKDNWTPNVQY
jgi:hypothetical protein